MFIPIKLCLGLISPVLCPFPTDRVVWTLIKDAWQAQGMGIGKTLLSSSETIARRAGMQRVLLTVFGHNPEVCRFRSALSASLEERRRKECFNQRPLGEVVQTD